MSVAGINGTANYPVYTPGKATGKVSNNNFSQQINHAKAGNVHTFADTVKQTTGSDSVSRTEAYKDYLKQKYGNVRYESIGRDQKSLDRAGKSMSGNDVVIAPNILEQMANDPEKAAYYGGKIDDFFNATPMLKASFAARGLDYQPCGVVVHEDGNVTYIGGCADSPERVAEVNAINKAKREKAAAQRRESLERSQEAAAERRERTELQYHKQLMEDALKKSGFDTAVNYHFISQSQVSAAAMAYESAIGAYSSNVLGNI